jgi:hypothetical protein
MVGYGPGTVPVANVALQVPPARLTQCEARRGQSTAVMDLGSCICARLLHSSRSSYRSGWDRIFPKRQQLPAVESSSVPVVSIKFAENPGLTHLKTILNEPRSRENTTPVREPPLLHGSRLSSYQADRTGIFLNEATAIEFSSSMPRMVEKGG